MSAGARLNSLLDCRTTDAGQCELKTSREFAKALFETLEGTDAQSGLAFGGDPLPGHLGSGVERAELLEGSCHLFEDRFVGNLSGKVKNTSILAGNGGSGGARTRNLCRDRAAL